MINITNWPTQEPEQVEKAVIVAQNSAWQERIAQMTAEERELLIQQRQQRLKVLHKTGQSRRQSERRVLQNVVRQLPKAQPMQQSIPSKKNYGCKTCKDAGFIRQDLPHGDPQFGQAKLCPNCGLARKRRAIERMWPLGEATAALYNKPIRTKVRQDRQLVTMEPLVDLKNLMIDFIETLPKGVLILIEGGYGTVKTHSLAILYDRCWKAGKSAIYVGATVLEKMYTDFSDSQRSSYDEIRNEARFTRFKREKTLQETDFLFIDEAHRYTQRDGNGWTERQLFNLVNTRLSNHKTVVMAGNVLKPMGGHPGIHPGILDRAKPEGGAFLSLQGVPSGRSGLGRSPSAGWRKRKRK